MDRLNRGLAALLLLAVWGVSCGPPKEAPVPPNPVPQTGVVFPEPYFPAPTAGLWGWPKAVVYDPSQLDERQKAWVAGLEPAGGEGEVGLGFTRDFDGDGRTESVLYGAFANAEGDEGNFVLVVRGTPPQVLLKKELPGPPRFTVFTLKPDGTLWFGGGINGGEVTMNLTWDHGTPVFRFLTQD